MVEERLNEIKALIASDQFKDEKFNLLWKNLENDLGADDVDLGLLKIEMHMKEKNARNNQK